MEMKFSLTASMAALSLAVLALVPTAANATALPSGIPDLSGVADRFVQEEVRCNGGQAVSAIRSHSKGIEQVTFAPIQAGSGTNSKLLPVTCNDGEFRLDGKKLTSSEVATYAQANHAIGADREDWVLIITPTNQPAMYVPGFRHEVACQQAANIWQGRDRAEGDRPGHAVCIQR